MTKRLLLFVPTAFLFAGLALIHEQPAHAYADPGTGLLAIQAVGSTLVAAGWYLRRKIFSLFRRNAAPVVEEQASLQTSLKDESASVQ